MWYFYVSFGGCVTSEKDKPGECTSLCETLVSLMAATALLCARRSRNPNLTFNCRFFSSSSRSNDAGGDSPSLPSSSYSSSSTSSYLSDVKASLKQPPRESPSFPSAPSPSLSSKLEEIRKNLSEFRPRVSGTTPSLPRQPSPSPPISFQEIYKRNVIPNNEAAQRGKPSFDAIRESLRQMRPSPPTKDGQANEQRNSLSLSAFKDALRIRPVDPSADKSSAVIGGSRDALPMAIFGKDMKKRKEEESAATRTEFVRTYSYQELGQKLSILRPETRGENWFSVSELNERLVKLREMDLKRTEESCPGVNVRDLREGLMQLRKANEEKDKKTSSESHFTRMLPTC